MATLSTAIQAIVDLGLLLGLILLYHQQRTLMATDEERAASIRAIGTQITSVKAQVLAKVQKLEDAIAAQGNSSTDVDNAINEVKQAVQGFDDAYDDLPTDPANTAATNPSHKKKA
jgi:uncharacterized protein YoxC